jgi:chromosome segregation ATPase
MNDKQRLHEIKEVLAVILQEQDRLKAEIRRLQAERDWAEERMSQLEQAVNTQQQESSPFVGFSATDDAQLLQPEHLLVSLMQPQTQN